MKQSPDTQISPDNIRKKTKTAMKSENLSLDIVTIPLPFSISSEMVFVVGIILFLISEKNSYL